MSGHAVHAVTERNVRFIVVSTETAQTTTNPSQMLLPVYKLAHLPLPHSKSSPLRPHNLSLSLLTQMRYRCKYKVSSSGPNILEAYIIYLHVYMCRYMRFCHFFACATTQISLRIFKVSPELSCTDTYTVNALFLS